MAHSKQNIKQIKLYDYQQIAFDKIVVALKKTFRALMVMATGLGKTIMSIEVVKYFITPKDKVLFLCHDNGILNKTYKDYKKFIGESYTYAKFYGQAKDWEADKHHFVFATFQSVLAHLRNEKAKKKLFSPKHFTFIVVDESHHSQAETFAEVINYFKPKYKLGMTATPDREDQADIRDIFGQEVVNLGLPEAIAKGWLTPIDYKVLSDGLDEEKIRAVCKEVLEDNVRLTEKQINEKIFIKVRTEEQCKIVQKYSKTQKAIVFCENIEHLHHVTSILPSSVTIHSEQTAKVNESNFELFKNGYVQHVIVVDKFNEGIDVPDTELLVFLRATNSQRIFLQQLGRGLRPLQGKEKVTVLDFVANIDRIKEVNKLVNEIERIAGNEVKEKKKQVIDAPLHVEGKGFKFDFSDQVVNLLSVFEKIKTPFYETWQEASVACIALGIVSRPSYLRKFKSDSRLPANAAQYYGDFPGWYDFLKKEKPTTKYSSWKQASKICISKGIKSREEYKKYKYSDLKLPSNPAQAYGDFPGWPTFLGKNLSLYLNTWQEASKFCLKHGISTREDYRKTRKKFKVLPSQPETFYKNFPKKQGKSDWYAFFGKKRIKLIEDWKVASRICIKAGIKTQKEYQKMHKQVDERLPSNPFRLKDFPHWNVFLGRK